MSVIAPLWRIETELIEMLDSLDVCEESLRPELEEKIAAYVEASVEKVDRIDHVLASLDNVSVNAKAEIARLSERRQVAERAAERLKKYVLRVIEMRGGGPLRGANVTLTTRRSDALIVDDPAAVPAEWKRSTVVVDVPKEPLKKALKGGATIPGAHIEERLNLVRK